MVCLFIRHPFVLMVWKHECTPSLSITSCGSVCRRDGREISSAGIKCIIWLDLEIGTGCVGGREMCILFEDIPRDEILSMC